MTWRELPKIDAHVHIIPEEVHKANPDADDEFSFATAAGYRKLMEEYNIHRAIIMPFNDPRLMSMDFTVEAVHRNLLDLCQTEPRWHCFADVDIRSAPEATCAELQKALGQSAFLGVKLHPNNSGRNLDDAYNDAIADFAVKNGYPVAVHAYPSGAREQDRDEYCAPVRIGRWIKRHPGIKVIVCHLGGFQWEDAAKLDAHFDISAVLPDLTDRYGIKRANQILRRFGVDRLLFATDWPCSRSVQPARIMERYLELLDQMDFTDEEMHKIGHQNAEAFFAF